jgi:hypothetical protein
MKSLFSRVTAAVKQKKANEAVIKKEEKVVVQKKTTAKMRQAAMACQIAQTVVAPGRKGQGRNTTARTTAHEAMFNEAVPECKKTTTKVAEDL